MPCAHPRVSDGPYRLWVTDSASPRHCAIARRVGGRLSAQTGHAVFPHPAFAKTLSSECWRPPLFYRGDSHHQYELRRTEGSFARARAQGGVRQRHRPDRRCRQCRAEISPAVSRCLRRRSKQTAGLASRPAGCGTGSFDFLLSTASRPARRGGPDFLLSPGIWVGRSGTVWPRCEA